MKRCSMRWNSTFEGRAPALALFAAVQTNPPEVPVPEIRDIAPPIDVFPYPTWMVAIAAVLVLILAAGIVVLAVWLVLRKAPPPPLSPRTRALRELEHLCASVSNKEPYAFSVEVSDVLRAFIAGHFGLHAERQTSPEVLAAIADAPRFSSAERDLLARFLERCDLIKFARIEATSEDNEEILSRAIGFVRGASL